MTKRRTTRTIGSRLAVLLCACAVVCWGGGKKQPEPYGVVAGTVFQNSGFSLPGAAVTLVPKDDPKTKKLQTTSDARGEFAFRVPAAPATYVVRASLKGYQFQEKEAVMAAEGRVEVTFQLTPESNK